MRLKRILKDPIFIMNFKFYPKAHIINTFENCIQLNIPKLKKKGWFKIEHLVPIKYCRKCIFNLRGFYIYKEELFRKKFLPINIWDMNYVGDYHDESR